jgi:hypothetical protein
MAALPDAFARGIVVLVAYVALLGATGFLRAEEL